MPLIRANCPACNACTPQHLFAESYGRVPEGGSQQVLSSMVLECQTCQFVQVVGLVRERQQGEEATR